MYREHPVKILKHSVKNMWLLIFPLLRGFKNIRLSADFFSDWLRGAWFDITMIAVIILFGLLQWLFSTVTIGDEELIHKSGIIVKVRRVIPYRKISSVSQESPFWLMPFSAVKFRCDTGAGILTSADMKLTLDRDISAKICSRLPEAPDKGGESAFPRPTVLSVILFSLFFSSGLSGAVYMAAFFCKGGDISRQIISEYLRRVSEGSEMIAGDSPLRLSGTAFSIGVFFIAAWLFSFMLNILRYSRFGIKENESSMMLSYGIFIRREHRIMSRHINYTDLRQNLIMKLFHAITVHINCSGYGGESSSLPVLVPVTKEKSIKRSLEGKGLLGGKLSEFRPRGIRNMWQYLWAPVLTALLAFPLHIAISGVIPELYELTLFAAIMAEVPAVWYILIKTTAFFTSSISLYDDKMMIRCNKYTTFHSVIAERNKLVLIKREQTLFQKRRRACTLSFRFEGEKRAVYKVKGLAEAHADTIVSLLEHDLLTHQSPQGRTC